MDVSVIIPVYNEERAILDVLKETLETLCHTGWNWEVIVVDDGSTDNTTRIVETFPEVKLVRHPYNMGGGRARNTGIRQAKGEILIISDGDGTYPMQEIPRLVEELFDCDMVVGARKREAGTLKLFRIPAKFLIRKLAEFITGFEIPDLNSGMRALKKETVLPYLRMLPPGHSWVSTLSLALLSNGHVVKYIPIDYFPRKGKSTFHPVKDTLNYLMTVIRTVTWFSPLKTLLPIAFLFLVGGLGKLISDVIRFHWHVPVSTAIILLTGIQIFILALLADMIAKRL